MSARLTESDLDSRIAERLTMSPRHRSLVETPAGIFIGQAYTPPPAPVFDEAARIQRLVLLSGARDGEYRRRDDDVSVWIRTAEGSAGEDEHAQAMAASPASRNLERTHRVVDWIVYAAFFGLLLSLCVSGWNAWLPGGGR